MAKKVKKVEKKKLTRDDFIKSLFQTSYDFFKKLKAPDFLVKVSDLILSKIRIPQLAQIINVAYKVSKSVEDKKMTGLAKKGEVVKAIEKFTGLIGVKLPTVMKNFINELVCVYIKLGF